MSMTGKAAPPSMGQWPGANINVVMEALCVLGCMGTEGMDSHGYQNMAIQHKAIYNVDPYYKTANQIHSCSVRLCLVTHVQPICNRKKIENKSLSMQVLVPSALKSNHRRDTAD